MRRPQMAGAAAAAINESAAPPEGLAREGRPDHITR